MFLKSTYFLTIFLAAGILSSCVGESFVESNYTPTVAGYSRGATTGNIARTALTPANAIAANARASGGAAVTINDPAEFNRNLAQQSRYAPNPIAAAPSYSGYGNAPYGSLTNSTGVISTGVFMPAYNSGYQPPAYGGVIYSPVR